MEDSSKRDRRDLLDVDGKRIRPGDVVRFPADIMSNAEPANFTFAGFDPGDPRMVMIAEVITGRRSRVAPGVIGARIVGEGATAAEYGTAQTIHEVAWHLRKEVTREAYLRDLAYAEDLRFPVYEWTGEDREGEPLVISWVVTSAGNLLSAYEIQGRA